MKASEFFFARKVDEVAIVIHWSSVLNPLTLLPESTNDGYNLKKSVHIYWCWFLSVWKLMSSWQHRQL